MKTWHWYWDSVRRYPVGHIAALIVGYGAGIVVSHPL